jgi:hypothetical protein
VTKKQGQLVGDENIIFKETKSIELLNSMCEFMCESFSKISKNRKKQEKISQRILQAIQIVI